MTHCQNCNRIDLSSISTDMCLACFNNLVEQYREQIAKLTISSALARRSGDIIKARVLQRQRTSVISQLDNLKAKELAA